ncbi:MAG: recombinase family protein [Chloroflexota bacterium]
MNSKSATAMPVRVAIYARVSSERQAAEDRVSIEVQVKDCEALCQEQGYHIVGTYIDQEKYRVSGKLVQPSAERKDRPAYQSMLKAARDDRFDLVIAWKEDRLYRGMYAAMPLSELLDEKGRRFDIELVKETFDRKMLGIKAAMGKIEVDNIRERMLMGRRERLERGEVPGGDQVRYGYFPALQNKSSVGQEIWL